MENIEGWDPFYVCVLFGRKLLNCQYPYFQLNIQYHHKTLAVDIL